MSSKKYIEPTNIPNQQCQQQLYPGKLAAGLYTGIELKKAGLLDIPLIFRLMLEGSITGSFSDRYLQNAGHLSLLARILSALIHRPRWMRKHSSFAETLLLRQGELEIGFPRISGYRKDLPEERLEARFDEDSHLTITPQDIGPTSVIMEGIVGEGVTMNLQVLENMRPSEISFNLGKYLLNHHFRDEDGLAKRHLFPQIQRIARRWIDGGYLVCKGVPVGAILYESSLAAAAQKIHIALSSATDSPVKAVLDPYNPKGSTSHVNFITSKSCWTTGARPPKSQISHVVLDSSWEEQLALTLENHPRVLAYAKNQAMGFEVPYLDGAVMRRYIPDFLVRLDLGGDEPLNLVLEVKGFRGEDAKIKAATMRDLWVPGVNALGGFGRWEFAEFCDWAVMDEDFAALVERLRSRRAISKTGGRE